MKRRFKLCFGIAVLSVVWCSAGFCKEASDSQSTKDILEEMIVTATKSERPLKDVSTNMAVLTREDIAAYQPTDVMDLLRHVPGLVLNGMGSSKSSFYAGARGIQPSSRGMLIMVDGVEMNDPSNYLSVAAIPLSRIERIEVVKAPSSALYGPSAVGGVIHVITRKPTEVNESGAVLTYGSFEHKQADLNTQGVLSSGLTYGVNYRYLDTDGYRNSSHRQSHGVTPRLGVATDTFEMDLFSNIVATQNDFPGGLPLATFGDDPKPSLQPDRTGDSLTTATGLRVEWTPSRQTTLTAKSSYRTNDWETEDYGFRFKGEDYNTWTAEATYSYDLAFGNVENSLLLGSEYRRFNNEPTMAMDENFGGELLSSAAIEERLWGFFFQDHLHPTKKLMISIGGRYDAIQTDFKNRLDPAADYDNRHGKWSPRLGISYLFAAQANLFANYTEGIRSVNLARPAFRLTENVDPEKEVSFEMGLRGTFGGRFRYQVTGFRVTTRDKIIQNGRYDYANAGEAQSIGIEAELSLRFSSGAYAAVDYTYMDAVFKDYQTESERFDDNRVPLVPENIFGASIGWRHRRLGCINADLRYVDKKYIDDANTLVLDDYTVVDVKYSYNFKPRVMARDELQLSLAVNNLFDEIYAEYGEADGGLYIPGPVAFPADGRAVFASLSYHF